MTSPAVAPRRASKSLAPLKWAIPGIIAGLLFQYAAVTAGAWYAFTDWNGLKSPNFIGLGNFAEIFSQPDAFGVLSNTLLLAVVYVVGVNVVGLLLAIGLNRTLKSRFVLRSLFFAPVVMSPLAVSYIWQFILDVRGPFNAMLGNIGLRGLQKVWLGDPQFALMTIAVVMIWQFAGLTMALYLAGLQSIPVEIDEAASVDGASPWRRFRRITLPLLAPAATVSISLTTIFGLRVFDQVMALTRGGPGAASETLATAVFKYTFLYGRFGYGAAFSLVLTVLVLVVSAVQISILRARERRL